MSNFVYKGGKQALLEAKVNWLSDSIKAILIDTAKYTASTAHASLSDVPVDARVSVSGTLTGRTTASGIAGATGAIFTALPSISCEAVIIAKTTGVDSTSVLLCYIDQALNLPVTPSTNGNGTLSFSDKVFAL